MSKPVTSEWEPDVSARKGPSLFGPILLIAVGVFFLLSNLGIVGDLNWGAALQLWPLLLVFLGMNIIAQQVARPWGGIFSALIGLLAVGVFGAVLLVGPESIGLGRWVQPSAEIQVSAVDVPADEVTSAEITIDFAAPAAILGTAVNRDNLLEGSVSHTGEVVLSSSSKNGQATVALATKDRGWSWLNPVNWFDSEANRWELGINGRIPTELRLDVGSGSVNFNLLELTLTDLRLDGGSGQIEAVLPGGVYDVAYDAASGSTRMTLPRTGQHIIEIDGGSGSLNLLLPSEIDTRFEIEKGSGAVNVDSARLVQLSAEGKKELVWQTADYDASVANTMLIRINGASGAISIEDLVGR